VLKATGIPAGYLVECPATFTGLSALRWRLSRRLNGIIEGREVAVGGARTVVLGRVRLSMRFVRVS
jgi:hypothetical protein